MRPRRTHTKSRNGCDQCKKRRVKCDERGPPCSNCISRELDCSYLKIPKARGLVSAAGSPLSPAASQHSSQHSSNIESVIVSPYHAPAPSHSLSNVHGQGQVHSSPPNLFSSLRSLELMHKFSTDTYRSLSNDPSDYNVWQTVIPRKALEHDFLMNGILAIAALHTAASVEPAAALSYIDSTLEYHTAASVTYRKALDHLTPFNCDAVFAHSIITTVIGIALPRLTATRDETSNMTENIVVVFELLQGVRKIIWISDPWLHSRLFTCRKEFLEALVKDPEPDADAAMDKLNVLNDSRLANVDPEQHRINRDAVALLRRCFARHAVCSDAASVLTWLAAVEKDFVSQLRLRKPFPVLVLMHWGALLNELDGQMWWARNSGKALVIELTSVLQPDILQWEGAHLWPRQKVGL